MSNTATGTAAPLELILGGKTYIMRPLGFAEIGEFERWAQQRYIDQTERLIANLDEAGKATIRMETVRLAQKLAMNTTDPEATRIMDELASSVEGVARLVFLSVRRSDPSATVESVGAAMVDQASMEVAMRTFNRLNRGDETEAKKKVKRTTKARAKKSR